MNLTWYGGRKKERYSVPNDSTIIQRGAAAALTGSQDCVAQMRQVYQHRRDLAVNLLKDLGRYVYTPHGAFYLLGSSAFPVLSNKEKAVKAGLLQDFVPDQDGRDDILRKKSLNVLLDLFLD